MCIAAHSRQLAVGRLSPYFIAVIIGTLLLCLIGIAALKVYATVTQLPEPHQSRQTLSHQCAQHIVEYDESDWDEETETYPTNHAWFDCMGVGLVAKQEMYREDI